MYRFYVERLPYFDGEAKRIFKEVTEFLGVKSVKGVRYLNRYDVENVSESVAHIAATRVFSERQSDEVYETLPLIDKGEKKDGGWNKAIIWEYLPGQYDQRADSAQQCLSLLREQLKGQVEVENKKPIVRCAKIVLLKGEISCADEDKIKHYLINEVDSRETDDKMPKTLAMQADTPPDIKTINGFITESDTEIKSYREKMALAMDDDDIIFLRDYFKSEGRDPTETEIRVLDTYWSDHCRHTTFLTELKEINIESGEYSSLIKASLEKYKALRGELYADRKDKDITLMDMAVIGAKWLRAHGKLDDLEVSEENNASSIYIDVDADGKTEKWILMFKNETHNHPTEIEPFGGAATCIGGAIRDPLSGRAWVYQALRVTGASDPTVPLSETIKGKLPQIKLCRESAQGFSSYGNQIGLATGQVVELYHTGYAAKRLETGAVIAAAPKDWVKRERGEEGDVVILLGGGTGRDGIGGATGSSKVHTTKSVETCAAEVQKGCAVEERKIQRLFRNKDVCLMIRRANDFGAGGVAVAVGELSSGLDVDLDKVPKKYEGLNGTELAISESQERMAVVVKKENVTAFIKAAEKENLNAVEVAKVTDTNRLVMRWRGKVIVDIARAFLDAAGAHHEAIAFIESPKEPYSSPLVLPLKSVENALHSENEKDAASLTAASKRHSLAALKKAWLENMADLSCCSQRGLSERFDGSIGSASVLFPFGGKEQCTAEAGMAAKIPLLPPHETRTVSIMTEGFDPRVGQWSPWHGAQTAVLSSLAKITCLGGRASSSRLSFQEFFGRAVSDKKWGYPAAALLGALDAQLQSTCAAIGGKDSMSGTFEDINVPHTLLSFAVTTENEKNITSGSFKECGDGVYLILSPYTRQLSPDWDTFMKNSEVLYTLNAEGKIAAMYPVCAGGVAEAVTKMALGNSIGIKISALPIASSRAWQGGEAGVKDLFIPQYGSIIVECRGKSFKDSDIALFKAGVAIKIGDTTGDDKITIDTMLDGEEAVFSVPLAEAKSAWERTLSRVYPIVSDKEGDKLPPFAFTEHKSLESARGALGGHDGGRKERVEQCKGSAFSIASGAPRVIIPVFPGTNCEYDMARAFMKAGAIVKTFLFVNRTAEDGASSLAALCRGIENAEILALAGGFSCADEPDGSGKFIANVLRSPKVADKVMELLRKRDGLILGICNGFQALIKSGLLPYGEIRDMTRETPTLTFNRIGRHVSRIVRTKVVSAISPWAMDSSILNAKVHLLPVSHGEGRVVMPLKLAKELFEKGQVFTQYVDKDGVPTMSEMDNPNGSVCAIEGLTSECGRVLGKMGHSERTIGSTRLIKNIPCGEGESITEDIFSSAVRYFR